LVTTHQIRNVLRIYGNQLKKRNTIVQDTFEPDRKFNDRVDISSEARHKQAMTRMSEKVMAKASGDRRPLMANGHTGNAPIGIPVDEK